MRSRLSLLLAMTASAVGAAAQSVGTGATDPGTSYVFELAAGLDAGRHALLHRDFDVLDACCGADPGPRTLRVVVQPGPEHDRFRGLFPGARLVDRGRPFAAIAAERAAAAGLDMPDSNYFTPQEIEQEIDALVAQYPAICQKVDLTTYPGATRTWGNRSIFALKMSDAVANDEDEPAILIAAQHHARELNAPYMVIGAMRRVAQAYATDPALRAAVDDNELWFVPCVNPDGVDWVWTRDNFWRKNIRDNGNGTFGVDLNRNYPTNWGRCGASTRTSSSIYRGPSAGSEPETRTMIAFVETERPQVYIDFHSSGQEVLFPYPSCASWTSATANLLNQYIDRLRLPMNYATRLPSASAEAPEDFWTRSGTLSFLTEISTSFQPVFSQTIAEEARVWPGLQAMLTTWKPAIRGHVRSLFQNEPLEATLTFTPNQYAQGETTVARERDGRYAMWLPLGSWTVRVDAPGHVSQTAQVQVSGFDADQPLEFVLVPTLTTPTLTKTGTERIGTTTTLDYVSPGDAGLLAWIALSDGTAPGLALGTRTLPMNPDGLMAASLSAAPFLAGNLGNLDANDRLTAQLNFPALPTLVGIDFFACGITFEPGWPEGVRNWSAPVPIQIRP